MHDASQVAQIIQLSVAPVFLLAGIGALLNVVTSRLGRVVDRARLLESELTGAPPELAIDRIRTELAVLDRRMVLSQRSIFLCTLAALLVCFVVAALFLSTLANFYISEIIALTFICAMTCLIFGLSMFLAEVLIATRTIRVRAELFMKEEDAYRKK